jgi:uncharacterized protein YcbK (DUF882 family)
LTGDALGFENGNPIREDRLTPTMRTALNNLRNAVRLAGGSLNVTSAWRSPEYQAHLFEIKEKRNKLNNKDHINNFPQCEGLRAIVNAESTRHGLGRRVGETSRHTEGNAFDANWSGISDVQLNQLSGVQNLHRPIDDDVVHFQFR